MPRFFVKSEQIQNNTIEINVKHIRGIKTIEYNWNEEEAKTIEGNNSTEINEEIELIGGTNVLSLKITEENGESVTYKKEYTAPNLADIQLEAVVNTCNYKILIFQLLKV